MEFIKWLRFWPEEIQDVSVNERVAGGAGWRPAGNQKHCFQHVKFEAREISMWKCIIRSLLLGSGPGGEVRAVDINLRSSVFRCTDWKPEGWRRGPKERGPGWKPPDTPTFQYWPYDTEPGAENEKEQVTEEVVSYQATGLIFKLTLARLPCFVTWG